MRRLFRSVTEPAPFGSHLATLLKLGKTNLPGSPASEEIEAGYFLGIGLALLSGFAFQVQVGGKIQTPAGEALSRMDDFVSREYAGPLKLANLATAAGVSRQHLMKLFRERGWPTPTQYLYGKRLEIALDWLSHTGLSIEEIALRCGFANAFHFSRKFRHAYGKSPRAWRMQAWSQAKK
jgi:AraC-like DNA-binding protein